MTLTGLEGEVINGFISRIGVLECARDHSCLDLAPLSLKKRLPWYKNRFILIDDDYEAYPYYEGSWTSSTSERPVPHMEPVILARRDCEVDSTLTSVAADMDLEPLDFFDSRMYSPKTRPFDGPVTRLNWFPIESRKGERIVGIEVDVTELPSALRVSYS